MFPAAGKRGKRQSCQSKEPTANEWNDSVGAAIIWRNDARRHLVVATAARFSRLIDFYRLFHVGRFSGGTLFFWQLYLALLFAGVHRGRAAQELLGRTILPVDHAECTSIFSLSRGVFSHRTLHRRLEGAVVFKWIWNRRRHNFAGNQCCFARRLYVWLSLATAFGRRISRSIFQITNVLPRLRVRDLFQSPPHALGVAESLLGRLCRSLRPSVRNGYLA